ncbi:MAG TPA: hypothetical protein VLW25_11070 [Bryobacteraceae bacterium]|nr:hypothetical protein [Bryobacteraceae bacterium]
MAYEKSEHTFPCFCGEGKLIGEWKEHDTWPSSNKYIQWHFDCGSCATEYVFKGLHFVRVSDAQKYEALLEEYNAACRDVAVAGEQYEGPWINYVLGLSSVRAKWDAVGGGSYSTFLKKSRLGGFAKQMERDARRKFRVAPKECLGRLLKEDAEVNRLHVIAENKKEAANAFWTAMEKLKPPIE